MATKKSGSTAFRIDINLWTAKQHDNTQSHGRTE